MEFPENPMIQEILRLNKVIAELQYHALAMTLNGIFSAEVYDVTDRVQVIDDVALGIEIAGGFKLYLVNYL
jgi:hypothetical protein